MKQILLFLLLAVASGAIAQTSQTEILTNAKVVSMVKGGLPKAVILKSIDNKPANFDTSTDAMIALKKQGVPDDVITAMVAKAENAAPAKTATVTNPAPMSAPAAVPFNPVNTKDCKFSRVTMVDGSSTSMVQASGKLGNFMIGKVSSGISMNYKVKSLLAMFGAPNNKNLAALKVDSVQFLFVDNTVIVLRAYNGMGTLANENNQLQPQLTDVHFSVIVEGGSKAETTFRQKKLKGFLVKADRDGRYGDVFNDKQQDKLLQAFICIQ